MDATTVPRPSITIAGQASWFVVSAFLYGFIAGRLSQLFVLYPRHHRLGASWVVAVEFAAPPAQQSNETAKDFELYRALQAHGSRIPRAMLRELPSVESFRFPWQTTVHTYSVLSR